MSSKSSALLASAAAQFIVATTGQKLVKVERAAKAPKAPKHVDSVTVGKPSIATSASPMVAKGSMTAAEFQIASRDAGRRDRENAAGIIVSVVDPSLVRGDEIKAIAAFVGYDYREPHGTQLDCAKRAALRGIRGVTALPEGASVHGASVTVGGLVAGMPDAQRKIVQDLVARERLLTAEWIDLSKLPAEETVERTIGADTYKGPAGQLAELAQAALEGIREDLAGYRAE